MTPIDGAPARQSPPTAPMAAPAAVLGGDASGAELHRAGIACSTGQGAALSYVEAHKWFNLAALAGVEEAKAHRREIAALMSPEEIAAAQAGARAWLAAAALGRRRAEAPLAALRGVPSAAVRIAACRA